MRQPLPILPAIALFAAPGVALAQAAQCSVPAHVEAPPPITPDAPANVVPVTSYSLALSWSPEWCRTREASPRDRQQCGGRGNGGLGRFGFVLHGLWPEGDGGTPPQWCAPATPLSAELVRRNLCLTPSSYLLAHEWAKHGTCAWRDPQSYFTRAGQLYGSLRFPDMASLSRRRDLTAGDLRRAIAAGTPVLFPQALRVQAGSGGWLREVHVCYSRQFRPMRCRNAGLPDRAPLKIWRG